MAFAQPKSSTNKDGFCFDSLLALAKNGPCWDGDVPSKSGRDDLIDHGLAVRVIVKGEQGFTALTYAGCDFFTRYMGCATLSEALAKQRARFEESWRQRNPNGDEPPV
jgi:hypothetical protein